MNWAAASLCAVAMPVDEHSNKRTASPATHLCLRHSMKAGAWGDDLVSNQERLNHRYLPTMACCVRVQETSLHAPRGELRASSDLYAMRGASCSSSSWVEPCAASCHSWRQCFITSASE